MRPPRARFLPLFFAFFLPYEGYAMMMKTDNDNY